MATLYALETIFYLRHQLAQAAWEDNEPIYEELCNERLGQIAKALTSKYRTVESLCEKIEILERLTVIGQIIRSNDFYFALEEAYALKELPELTYAQKLRLDWIPNINSEDDSQIVADLLPTISPSRVDESVFDLETLTLISDSVTPSEREAIFNRFTELVKVAIVSKDTEAISGLLALAAYWNIDPNLRKKIKELTNQFLIPNSSLLIDLSLPILRLNPIAAEIYSRIDTITGKYDILSA
ncbi:MAG: hypothetical protein NC311_11165 [Muribaculaceae bacterium]|nr:hypothetical protein [Muribaculaceae bacterium]